MCPKWGTPLCNKKDLKNDFSPQGQNVHTVMAHANGHVDIWLYRSSQMSESWRAYIIALLHLEQGKPGCLGVVRLSRIAYPTYIEDKPLAWWATPILGSNCKPGVNDL